MQMLGGPRFLNETQLQDVADTMCVNMDRGPLPLFTGHSEIKDLLPMSCVHSRVGGWGAPGAVRGATVGEPWVKL